MIGPLKRLLVGRPLSNTEQDHQRISKRIALAVFSSDAISSTAYATEEILVITAIGVAGHPSSLQLGLDTLLPIAGAVAVLLTIVVSSYRQTIFAYPGGGGSYVVSRENLGKTPSLIAGASLLVDYVLTVAVSISAGVVAITSIDHFGGLGEHRVLLGVGLIFAMTLANLRGVKESGRILSIPTYVYIVMLVALVGIGLYRTYFGHLDPIPFNAQLFAGTHETGAAEFGGSLTLLIILRGFSSGAVALTGVEAISNGVPAFKKPESRNAATTMIWMGLILGILFFGVSTLAHHLRPFPYSTDPEYISQYKTVFAQMGQAVFQNNVVFFIFQFATAGILVLAANTAYADFPRLSSIIARDGYLPRQFANRGDRLVFSNGILFLALAAALLIIIFNGDTSALIPLYAVGVFTSFTLSQTGMVVHHRRTRHPGWKRSAVINSVGAVATCLVALIIGISKFTEGAWVSIVVVAVLVVIFLCINTHYRHVREALAIQPDQVRHEAVNHTVIILVGQIHRGVISAVDYAKSLRPQHIAAVFVSGDEEEQRIMEDKWIAFGMDVPLEIIHSPYRELIKPVIHYLDELDNRWHNDTITVVVPEFMVKHWWERFLHNQSALLLRLAILRRPHTVLTSVPYHVRTAPKDSSS